MKEGAEFQMLKEPCRFFFNEVPLTLFNHFRSGIEADANCNQCTCSLCPLSLTSLFGSSATITDNEGTGCILPWLDTGRSFDTITEL
jgi:hypothetical protein